MRVLIIEDDSSVGAAIQLMMAREGWDTVHAPDADAATRIFQSSRFDLLIVDIFLPGVNGLKTIAEFRNQTPDIPVLAISGFRFRDSMDPGLDYLGLAAEAGAAVCLRKPFTYQQLVAAVRASLAPPRSDIRSVKVAACRVSEQGFS